MVHNLPATPAFRDERVDSPISEFALRVVVEFEGWKLYVVGTATLICGHLAITARHVLEDVVQKYGAKQKSSMDFEIDSYELKLYQVLPGPGYRIWRVVTAWPTATDIALLHLGLDRTTFSNEKVIWKQPLLRALSPPVGQKVVAFGYRESKINVTEGSDGQHHIELNDRPTTSIGTIRQVYPSGRDTVMLPFPCFEIEARFDRGMSGGMVIDETGKLCGLICTGLQHDDPNAPPISYVASLWPMLKTVISADRGDRYLRSVSYPVIDLAIDGLIAVTDLHELDPIHFPDKQLTSRR
jgi:Trypsin-like peptidase domain